jgi:hypothetical protein
VDVEGGVGENRAAVCVEESVGGCDAAVAEAGAVEVVKGFGERGQERDQLAR